MEKSSPATMSIAFLHPVFDALIERGSAKAELAAQLNVSEKALYDPAVLMPANSVYTFLGWSAEIAGDPLFNARIGQQMAAGGWAPLVPLMASARTVGDFFQKFSHLSSEQGRAVTYRLEVEGPVALWRMIRPPGASADARFADAFAAGYFVQILKLAAKDNWDPVQIVAVLAAPSLIPCDLLPPTSVLSGQVGLNLRFPSALLGLDMCAVTPPDGLPALDLPNLQDATLAERVRQLIEQRIFDPSLGVASIAAGVGLSKWKLQSTLSAEGTSVSEIRENVRRALAIERVAGSTDSVESIARDLGYSNSSNFARAFRGWTGKSPREIR